MKSRTRSGHTKSLSHRAKRGIFILALLMAFGVASLFVMAS